MSQSPYDPTKPYKDRIQEQIRKTWETPYATAIVLKGSPYPYVRLKDNYLQLDHTDGIGTKGELHWKDGTFAEAVQDALAMNLNDLLVMRARPIKLQNHLTIPADDHNSILEIITHLCNQCRKRDILVSGGETSIHNNIGLSMDLSLTVTGICDEPVRANEFRTGDALVGLPSTGLHSNGFTFVRLFCPNVWEHRGHWKITTPTEIYWDKVYPLVTGEYLNDIHGMVHIAGGGFSRLLEHIKPDQQARLRKWPKQAIFQEISWKADAKLMYNTFNCGIGFILSVDPDKAEQVATLLGGSIIGEIAPGQECRMAIQSIFGDYTLESTSEVSWTRR